MFHMEGGGGGGPGGGMGISLFFSLFRGGEIMKRLPKIFLFLHLIFLLFIKNT